MTLDARRQVWSWNQNNGVWVLVCPDLHESPEWQEERHRIREQAQTDQEEAFRQARLQGRMPRVTPGGLNLYWRSPLLQGDGNPRPQKSATSITYELDSERQPAPDQRVQPAQAQAQAQGMMPTNDLHDYSVSRLGRESLSLYRERIQLTCLDLSWPLDW